MTAQHPNAAARDYYVTVCSACRCASCWHGVFLCQESQQASTIEVLASVLRKEDREHTSYFAVNRMLAVCGGVRYVA